MSDFVRLDGGDDGGKLSDDFWPSFTDIMMVVVMIFLITSIVLISRNWDLVRELRATMEAERRAAEIARSATETSASLEARLAQVQHELSVVRMQLMQAREEGENRARLLEERDRRIGELMAEQDRLQAELADGLRRAQGLEAELETVTSRLARAREDVAAQAQRLAELRAESERLQARLTASTGELRRLRAERARDRERLAALSGEYETLKGKYEKLIKPARTARGKHVVEVRYEKVGGRYRISFREDPEQPYQVLDRAQLEARLQGLKERYHHKLYVKIVIPDASGLSYSEAWEFTRDVLRKYDYYYQE